MASNETQITLYKRARTGLKSLFVQASQVSLGLIAMLVITGGNPPGWMVSASFFLGVGFVAYVENKRQLNLKVLIENDEKSRLVKEIKSKKESGQNLENANLSGANLRNANLSGANLSGVDLSGADLRDANLIGANLSGVDLSGANLSDANLIGANLSGADLSGANLSGANLSDADLSFADLSGADLIGANVEMAKFAGSKGIDEELKLDLIKRGAIFQDNLGDMADMRVGIK